MSLRETIQMPDKWDQYVSADQPVDRWEKYAESNIPMLKSAHQQELPQDIDHDKLGMALVNSHMLSMPASTMYQNHDLVQEQFKKRGVDTNSINTLAKDFEVGLQRSISGLLVRGKLPDTLKDPTTRDNIVSGLSQMIADLPFYGIGAVTGGAVGGAAGSEVPIVGNVLGGIAGAGIGTFAVPAAIRESLVQGIRKGDIKSFGDLAERTVSALWAGAKEAPVGLAATMSGGATIPLRGALGPAAKLAEPLLKVAQQGAAIETVSKFSEGKMPTADGFVVNTALMLAMHVTMGSAEKAFEMAPKVHDRLLNEYSKNGTHPDAITAESLTRAQESPTEDVIDRINEISRDTNPEEPTTKGKEAIKKAPEEESVVPDLPPASLRPAIREEDGTVHIGGEGEFHPDILERMTDVGESKGELTVGDITYRHRLVRAGEGKNANYDEIEIEAYRGDKRIGKVSLGINESGEGDNLAVSSGLMVPADERGKGVARQMYENLPAIAKRYGIEIIQGEGAQSEGGEGVWKSLVRTGKAYLAKDDYDQDRYRMDVFQRGFVDRNDQFYTRDEAKAKLHEEEPEVYKHWEQVSGDPEGEFHTTDYNEALRRSTGIKNAAVDVQRAQRELPPLESDASTRRSDVYGQAKADVDSGKVDPMQIAESVNKIPRGISDAETDALNYYNAQLSNQHADTMDTIDRAK